MTEIAFEVLDALDGFTTLNRRSPTLDGAVPLRVAQACLPLLEGNAFGFQATLTSTVFVRRRLGRPTIHFDPRSQKEIARAHRTAIPRLVAQGFLAAGGEWHETLATKMAWVEGTRRPVVRLWTGLLIRAVGDLWLRVAAAANRRNRHFAVRPVWIAPSATFMPLVVEIEPRPDIDEIRLEGEIACISAHPSEARVSIVDLQAAPHLGRSHAAFYDPDYFETKRGEVTRKYRRLVSKEHAPKDRGRGTLLLACSGTAAFDVAAASNRGARRKPTADGTGPGYAVFRNAVAFSARYDGHTLALETDARALKAGAEAIERTWASVYGDAAVEQDRRALWYLTKYFTPHPPGEPHFFVKPWAFASTPPGWSALVEGIHGEGYDVMRGVVSTDVFHATPAVFSLHGSGSAVRVAAGEPLLELHPMPRWLLAASWRRVSWLDELPQGSG